MANHEVTKLHFPLPSPSMIDLKEDLKATISKMSGNFLFIAAVKRMTG